MTKLSIDEMATFCKRKGFVYPNSEIYGGLAGFWDFGHLGVELKKNIKKEWWKFHVHGREDIVGIDGSIITHPKVWRASGHLEGFEDLMLTCSKCKEKVRADTFIEEEMVIAADGLAEEDVEEIIKKNKLKCPRCKGEFEPIKHFNLMFSTQVGPVSGNCAYLRPETAQEMFTNFKLVVDNARLKLPFGIAQVGKGFRNEISPRDFLFRCREFEMMEIEYFIDKKDTNNCKFTKDVENDNLMVFSAEMQKKNLNPRRMTVKEALDKNIIKTPWHAYWLALEQEWFVSLGANPDKFRVRQHLEKEKSHYALDTWDLEYEFPFGWKELQGLANRTDFDLKRHMILSNKDLSLFDEGTKKKIIPHVVCEPSQGLERAFLVFMFDAYNDDKKRGNVVLKLHPKLAPVKVAVFPLVNKLDREAKEVYGVLKKEFNCTYDKSGSVGRRYARNDEIGTPYCVTVDFDSAKNNDVTIRDRDTTRQVRVEVKDLKDVLRKLINQEIEFDKAGKIVK